HRIRAERTGRIARDDVECLGQLQYGECVLVHAMMPVRIGGGWCVRSVQLRLPLQGRTVRASMARLTWRPDARRRSAKLFPDDPVCFLPVEYTFDARHDATHDRTDVVSPVRDRGAHELAHLRLGELCGQVLREQLGLL